MLKELGISHIVSVGESAMDPPPKPTVPTSISDAICNSNPPAAPVNSLYVEAKSGNLSVLDLEGVLDDGIDSILPHLQASLDYIHKARREGGKVLVHCRVGVSRSASVVIAYLMKYLDLDLCSAYLLTRARRLNILIQVSHISL